MRIPEEQLDKFIELYKKKYGVELDHNTAYDKASRLLKLVELVESNTYRDKTKQL
jgi:hypothetical protein